MSRPDPLGRGFAESQAAGLAELASFGVVAPNRSAPATLTPVSLTPAALTPATGTPARPPGTGHARRRATGLRSAVLRWPLLAVILGIQALLSLRLIWSNTAFPDEALYQSAGHIELAHWLHHGPLPGYAGYFPGAPVLYPPLAALAGNLHGLAAARLLSLALMLVTTVLLTATTTTLLGRRAALGAAAIFAVAGPVQAVGAFATPAALALCLVAAAAWCIVSSPGRDESSPRLVLGVLALVLANAVAYPTMLFDLPVFALAGLAVAGERGTKAALGRAGYLAAATAGLLSAGLAVGGPAYLAGFRAAVIAPPGGGSSVNLVLLGASRWEGLAVGLAAAAVLISGWQARTGPAAGRRRRWIRVVTLAVLAAGGALAPLNLARLHTMAQLSRHSAFGIWFAAIAGGYALAWLSRAAAGLASHRLGPAARRVISLAAGSLVLAAVTVPAAIAGSAQAADIYAESPDSAALITSLRSLTAGDHGRYLAENSAIPAYYLADSVPWRRWRSTAYFSYTPPGTATTLTGRPAYRAALRRHYFSLVVLSGTGTPANDAAIVAAMTAAGGYQPVARIGPFTIWAWTPPGPSYLDRAPRGLPVPHQPLPPAAPAAPPSGPVEASYGHG
jgi:hypothetical protein